MPDLDEQLREAGARWRAEQGHPVVDVVGERTRSRPRRAAVLALIGVVVAVPVVAFVVSRANSNGSHPRVSVQPTTVPPATGAAGPDVIELGSEIQDATVLAVDGTRLWVTGYAPDTGTVPNIRGVEGPAHLEEIDSASGKVLGDVTLPDNGPIQVQVGSGAVWVSAQEGEASTEILKIDPSTMRVVARIPGVKDGLLAVTPDAVWATGTTNGLRRIDPSTARVVATIPLHGGLPYYMNSSVVAGPLGVFVSDGTDGTIQRIDPATNTAGPVVHVATESWGMIEVGGSVWVEAGSGENQLIEVAKGEKVGRTIALGERALGMVTDGRSVWLGTDAAHLLRVDTESRSVSRVALPTGAQYPVVAADPSTGGVWVTSNQPTPRLLRVAVPPITTAPTPVQVQAAAFTGTDSAWVESNDPPTLLHTADGGAHWSDGLPGTARIGINGWFALDHEHAWIAEGADHGTSTRVFRTTDGGAIWESSGSFSGGDEHFSFIDPSTGWVEVSQGAAMNEEGVDIFRTTDGGDHWQFMSRSVPDVETSSIRASGALQSGCDKTGITFTTAATGFATGACTVGTLLAVTHDAGRTWKNIDLPLPRGVTSSSEYGPIIRPPVFVGSFGLAFGDNSAAGQYIYVTHDGGVSWSTITAPSGTTTVDVIDATHWRATDANSLLSTDDAGATWQTIPANVRIASATLHFTSDSSAWALTQDGPVVRTDDGGHHWTTVAIPPAGSRETQR